MATTREEAKVEEDVRTRPVRQDAGHRAHVRFDEPELRAWMNGILNRHAAVGVAVGIVRHGSLEFFNRHGFADIASNTPIDADTVFRIGSVTKPFTAIAVMQLHEQGLVDLDAPANDYLRAYRLIPAHAGLRPATVRHLLTHTAGIAEVQRVSDLGRVSGSRRLRGRRVRATADARRVAARHADGEGGTGVTTIALGDVDLFVDVVGRGYPLVLMHGGPGADLWTLLPFRQLSDRFTLIFYDHRCNGRSAAGPVTSMTWQNLTGDADALRERLGFDKWAVLGHSFGGNVALEYTLRYPNSLSHLILLDTGGDSWWAQQNAPELLAKRGFSGRKVELARRWFNGRTEPWEFFPTLMRLGGAYNPHTTLFQAVRTMIAERRFKARPQAEIFGFGQLMKGWTVMDRLHEIRVPTLVMAGRDDFVFPPEHQGQLAARIPNARLEIIERAGHNPHDERTAEVMKAVTDFIPTGIAVPGEVVAR